MLYVVNKNAQIKSGEHKIHTCECQKRPKAENSIELGEFYNSKVAREEASKYYSSIDGCRYCCREIHLEL